MKETIVQSPVSIQALRGVNQTTSERLDEFATLQNVAPDQAGRMTRILGKRLIEKRTTAVMGIHQFWTAFGYGSRLSQTHGGVISDPEPPDNPAFKIPIIDEPLNCKPVKVFSNKLKMQYLDRRTDYVHLVYSWNRCAGTDFDSRTALVECSIAGVPIFDGTIKQAIVGYFADGTMLDFNHGGQNILSLGSDSSYPSESVVINLYALRQLAGNVAFTARFQLKGYFYSYLNQGNVVVQFKPKERKKDGAYARIIVGTTTSFFFPRCGNYNNKSWKANIVTFTSTPILTTGDHICYLYVKFHPSNQAKKDRIWIDDV
jgi:hypothetical protein